LKKRDFREKEDLGTVKDETLLKKKKGEKRA